MVQQKVKLLIYATTSVISNLKNAMLLIDEKGHTQKTTYHMIPFTLDFYKRTIYMYRELINDCWGLE